MNENKQSINSNKITAYPSELMLLADNEDADLLNGAGSVGLLLYPLAANPEPDQDERGEYDADEDGDDDLPG